MTCKERILITVQLLAAVLHACLGCVSQGNTLVSSKPRAKQNTHKLAYPNVFKEKSSST